MGSRPIRRQQLIMTWKIHPMCHREYHTFLPSFRTAKGSCLLFDRCRCSTRLVPLDWESLQIALFAHQRSINHYLAASSTNRHSDRSTTSKKKLKRTALVCVAALGDKNTSSNHGHDSGIEKRKDTVLIHHQKTPKAKAQKNPQDQSCLHCQIKGKSCQREKENVAQIKSQQRCSKRTAKTIR